VRDQLEITQKVSGFMLFRSGTPRLKRDVGFHCEIYIMSGDKLCVKRGSCLLVGIASI
jgi:hypothetical protein